MFAKWDDILAIEKVPETARGQCPMGGPPYARAILLYARALALAAKAAGAAVGGFEEERERLLGLAQAELDLLKVTRPAAVPAGVTYWRRVSGKPAEAPLD